MLCTAMLPHNPAVPSTVHPPNPCASAAAAPRRSLRYGTAGVKLLSGEDEPQQQQPEEAEEAAEGASGGSEGSDLSGAARASHTQRTHDKHGTKRRATGRHDRSRGGSGSGGSSGSERTLAKGRQAVAGAQAVYDRQRAAAGGDRGP